ncbi:hypothetical protein ID866_686 [Astraeus odoratus]|nr:hypothetical protein ID866_686 [Astraeus odoratus]
MLAAQGDLQRLLSTFFARPIFIETIYAHTPERLYPASPEHPITQSRQVHLVCAGKVVCIATSTVTITSPDAERIFLEEKFPIGQTFRKLGQTPRFTLLSVETPTVGNKRELRRTYTLETEGFVTEILEVFTDRDMFTRGELWFSEGQTERDASCASVTESHSKPGWFAISTGGVIRCTAF